MANGSKYLCFKQVEKLTFPRVDDRYSLVNECIAAFVAARRIDRDIPIAFRECYGPMNKIELPH